MGHTQASFAEPDFREHLLGGLQTVTGAEPADCGAPREATPEAEDFEKVTLDDDTQNPMELDVAPDGRVFYIERDGRVMIIKPDTGSTVPGAPDPGRPVAGERPDRLPAGAGLRDQQLGRTSPTPSRATRRATNTQRRGALQGRRRHARPRLAPGDLHLARTSAPSAATRPARSTSGPTAASTSPPATTPTRSTPTASTPIDERAGRQAWDAQRTSANTNDLNGKILRIQPNADTAGLHDPGRQPVLGRPRPRRGPRSSPWASATRSASRSTPRPAGC